MYSLVLTIHTFVVILLIIVILLQRGRSGGLIESLGGVESIFGTKTSSFMVKLTVVLATLFFITSISLVLISKKESELFSEKISYGYNASETDMPGVIIENKTVSGESQTQDNTSTNILLPQHPQENEGDSQKK